MQGIRQKGEGFMTNKHLPGAPPINIVLRRSARARRITLRVSALDGRVTLSLPKGVAERTALDFARDKEGWIRKHLARQEGPVIVGLGGEVPLEGRMLTVAPGLVRSAKVSGEELLVPNAPEMAGHRVRAFLKLRAKTRLTERSLHYANLVGRGGEAEQAGRGLERAQGRQRWQAFQCHVTSVPCQP